MLSLSLVLFVVVQFAASAVVLPPPVVTLCSSTDFGADGGICTAMLINTTYDESRPSSAAIVNVQGMSCYNLPSYFQGNISSFSVSNGTSCYLNKQRNCSDICFSPSGCNKYIAYPGYADLSTYGDPSWKDTIASFTCTGPFPESKRRVRQL